jgi:hypothetical protein
VSVTNSPTCPTVTFEQLRGMQFTQEPFVIGSGLLPIGGIMFIGGLSKSYKSFTSLTIAAELATGQPVFGATTTHARAVDYRFPVNRPYKVLVIEQELGLYDDRERALPIYNSFSDEHKQLMGKNLLFHAQDGSMSLEDECMTRMQQVIAEHKPEVLVLDPLTEFHRSNENSAQEMASIMRNVTRLMQFYNLLAVIINHHTDKPLRGGEVSMRDPADDLRGSSVLFGKGDSYLMIERGNKRSDYLTISFTVRRAKPISDMDVVLDWTTGRVRFAENRKGGHRDGAGRPKQDVQ